MSRTQTQTQGRPSRQTAPARAYDHLYDTVYQVSGAKDHRSNVATAIYSQTMVVPDNQNMFSELAHHPRATIRVKPHDPVPQGIPRDFNSKVAYHDESRAYAYATVDQRGRDQPKFVGKPNVSFLKSRRADIKYDSDHDVDPLIAAHRAAMAAGRKQVVPPKSRTVGTQSLYRESDTQTDPWTPEYVVRPGSAPEVLRLATLSYGQGLPAGLNEVIMIERARAKRLWEESLPLITDPASKALRVKLMEEQDAMEWRWREEEIEEIQAQRLQVLEATFAKREEDNVTQTNAKMEHVLAKQERVKAARDLKRQREGLKSLRRLVQKRSNPENAVTRRSLVADYSNPSSEVFAKTAREGSFTADDDADLNVVTSDYNTTFQGLMELEMSLPASVTTPRIVRPPKRPHPFGSQQHRKDRYRTKLETLGAQIKSRNAFPQKEAPLRFLEKIPPPPKRPPVQRVAVPEEGEEEKQLAVQLLQRLLRGRGAQAAMYEGKEQRRDLIAELRTTHALEKAEQEIKAQEKANVASERAGADAANHAAGVDSAVLGEVTGATIGSSLDFLSKELVRLQEERRVHAFAMLAEKQRRIREAEESGRRQREEALRAKQDEIFREISGVHATSIDTYLEDILLGSKSAVADEVARDEIRAKAAKIDMVANQLHDDGIDTTEVGALTITADLVSSFLLPEVARTVRRQGIKNDQRRFLVGAHRELYSTTRAAEKEIRATRAPRLTDAEGMASMEEEIDIDMEDQDVQDATLKIQAGFRGMQGRKEAKAKELDIVTNADKFLVRAQKKFNQFDTTGDGQLEGEELEKMASWVWGSFHPDGKALSDDELKALSTKIMTRADDDADAIMDFAEFTKYFQKVTADISKFRQAMAQKKQEADIAADIAAIDLNDPSVQEAGGKIQAGFRGMQGRKKAKRAKKDKAAIAAIDLDDEEVQKASLAIQAGYRGMKGRAAAKKLAADNAAAGVEEPAAAAEEEEVNFEGTDEEHAAAAKIQAGFRGHQVRKDMAGKGEGDDGGDGGEGAAADGDAAVAATEGEGDAATPAAEPEAAAE